MNCPPSVEAALKAHPFDQRRLLEVLCRDGLSWLTRIVFFATKQRAELREEVTLEVFRRLGSKTLAPRDLDCPGAWLARVISRDAIDVLRQMSAKKRGGGTTQEPFQESSTVDQHQATHPNLETKIDDERALTRIARIAIDLERPIAGRQRLGFLAFHFARCISQGHVVAAKNDVDRARGQLEGGLLRDADDTWTRLKDGLMRSFPMGVADLDDGHLELAFVLRSTHPGPVSTWAMSDKKSVANARDLVRKWAERGREQVKTLALAQGLSR